MKIILPIGASAFLFFGHALAAEQQQAKEDISSQKEKASYSLGYEAGRSMKDSAADLDLDIYIKALREGFAGDRAAMTDQEMREAIQSFQNEIKVKRAEEAKKSPGKIKQLSEQNKKAGETFLAQNAKKDGVVTLPSGLQYKIIKEGAGQQPAKTDKVVVHRGTSISGAQFDSTYLRGQPATFAVDKVIKGWTEALQLMKEGSRWVLYIPPDLAYGEEGMRVARGNRRGRIEPNETLTFDVELISVHPSPDGK